MTEGWAGPFSLDELLVSRVAGYWGEPEPSEKRPNAVKVVRNGDISRDGRLVSWADRFFSTAESAKAAVGPEDVLLTSSGDVGKVCQPGDIDQLRASNFVKVLRPNITVVSGAFLALLLQGPSTRQVLGRHTGGSTIPNLLASFFQESFLWVPPRPAQDRIVDLVRHLDALVAGLRAEADAADQARGALLASLLDQTVSIPARYDEFLGRTCDAGIL